MDPDHANVLKRELKLWAVARHRGSHFEISSLLWSAFRIVKRYVATRTPLVMPAEVAAIYISNPDLDSWYECEDCGYELPVRRARQAEQEQTIHFALCPLCGGQVSWCGFSVEQSRKKLSGTYDGDGTMADPEFAQMSSDVRR